MKAVLFDLDGTLLDTLEDLTIAVNFALTKMGFPKRRPDEIRRFLGNGAANLVRSSLPQGKEAALEETLPIFRSYYEKHNQEKTCPYPGILPLLDHLKEDGFSLAVISNKPDYAVQPLAKKHFPTIDYAVGEKEGVARKPAPDSIFQALTVLGVEKQSALYVGDSEVDLETAKAAGIPCIAVTWGFRDPDHLIAAGAKHLAHTAEELYKMIHALTQKEN